MALLHIAGASASGAWDPFLIQASLHAANKALREVPGLGVASIYLPTSKACLFPPKRIRVAARRPRRPNSVWEPAHRRRCLHWKGPGKHKGPQAGCHSSWLCGWSSESMPAGPAPQSQTSRLAAESAALVAAGRRVLSVAPLHKRALQRLGCAYGCAARLH